MLPFGRQQVHRHCGGGGVCASAGAAAGCAWGKGSGDRGRRRLAAAQVPGDGSGHGGVVIDAGANIGCDTVPLARRVTNSGRVFAFLGPTHLWFLEYLILLYLLAAVAMVLVPLLLSPSAREAALRAQDAGVADKVKFLEQDLFKTDISAATVITMYLLPDVNLALRPRLLAGPQGDRLDLAGLSETAASGVALRWRTTNEAPQDLGRFEVSAAAG